MTLKLLESEGSTLPCVVVFEAVGLGDRSYLVHDRSSAVVVDAQRNFDAYIEVARSLGVEITHVLETHVHNDYVSGGLALSRELGATYAIPAGESVAFGRECVELADGETINSGQLVITSFATPGHTPNHVSYLVAHNGSDSPVVLTGGSLLAGATGRTDLLGPSHTLDLARAQWHSVRRLLNELSPSTIVYPTHGFGSFCSATPTGGIQRGAVTIGGQRESNPAAVTELEEFVTMLCENPPPIPRYYAEMAELNRAGQPRPVFGEIKEHSMEELDTMVKDGGVAVDVRARRIFAAHHHPQTVNIELGASLATYFGWIIERGRPVLLLGENKGEIDETRVRLASIGREAISGVSFTSSIGQRARSYRVASFADLADLERGEQFPMVLDIRHASEWNDGHLVGAQHVPLPELEMAHGDFPVDEDLWVHCAAGFRAAIGASLLEGWGHRPILIDDDFGQATKVGLTIEP